MATFTFNESSKMWRAQICVNRIRDSASFPTKNQAKSWAIERAQELKSEKETGVSADKTLRDAFDRYADEVSVTKSGEREEKLRLTRMSDVNIGKPGRTQRFGDVALKDLTQEHISRWRDVRLATVSPQTKKKLAPSTVNREFKTLSSVLHTAKNEWRWIAEVPTVGVRRPQDPPPRDRLISEDEIDRLCLALNFHDKKIANKTQAVAVAFLFAIETAMRAGEICSLKNESISGKVAKLEKTKNGEKREVPLSKRAIKLISYLPAVDDETPLFNLSASSLDTMFRGAKERCGITDMTFHDTRHEAITRLAKKLGVLELARMVGHKDIKMLMIYYNETAENLASKLG